jgi:hypothetical protein
MHGHVDFPVFLQQISGFLGAYYLLLAVMNAVMAFYLWNSGKAKLLFNAFGLLPVTTATVWLVVAGFFTIISPIAMSGDPNWAFLISIPQPLRDLADTLLGPVVYSIGGLVLFVVFFVCRKFFVRPMVAWSLLNLSTLFMGLSMIDPNFAEIVTKPDNVPIVGLIFLLGFFTWLATAKAVENDERAKQGLPPTEKLDDEKVLVWPDLVYTELICMVALTAVLILWGILLQAPLEEPASAVKTPNPSKAPWYFLGLQEMLVYYDPWMAGVVLPSLVVFGLMAIPYIDFNKEGNGYYTIDQRKFAYIMFQVGFLLLWVMLIIMGTFMRGPNWNFFGLYETWDPHKLEVANNVNLSDYFWVEFLGRPLPKAVPGYSPLYNAWQYILRELPGIVLVLGYFVVLPPAFVLMSGYFRKMFIRMGFVRYMVMINLLLLMMLLPIKMVLRWSPLNLKYFIAYPEFLLNL